MKICVFILLIFMISTLLSAECRKLFCTFIKRVSFIVGCPIGWKLFPNTLDGPACYIVKNNYFSWYGARDDCLANSADLVSITSRAEQEFVTRELLMGAYRWLGFTDKDDEGRWAWSDKYVFRFFTTFNRLLIALFTLSKLLFIVQYDD